MTASAPELSTVAIVEDDKAARDALCSLLESVGLRTEAFGSAEEFVDLGPVENSSCLILDVRLPRMSGLELQRRLSGDKNSTPIIFITGRGDDKVREQALREGAVGFFHKPFDPAALLKVVHSTLKQTGE
jgi:FixJ family two-component response regulator